MHSRTRLTIFARASAGILVAVVALTIASTQICLQRCNCRDPISSGARTRVARDWRAIFASEDATYAQKIGALIDATGARALPFVGTRDLFGLGACR